MTYRNKLPKIYTCWNQLRKDMLGLDHDLSKECTLVYSEKELVKTHYVFSPYYIEKMCFEEMMKITSEFLNAPQRNLEIVHRLAGNLEKYVKIPNTMELFFNYKKS